MQIQTAFRLIVELPYRTLEHPSIKATRVNEIVFRIIGVAIKRYNHALSFSVRTTQILASKEIAVVPIANGVRLLNDEFKIHTAFEKLLDELTESLNAAATDQLIAKHFSMFLTHVCEIAPKLIIPHLSQMGEDLLNLDVNKFLIPIVTTSIISIVVDINIAPCSNSHI